jgi:8-oxo-dGTP diphosphatase
MSSAKRYVVGFYMGFGDDPLIALIQKKRPKWQEGKFNGIGGHVEETETPFEAMVREFREEAGLNVTGLKFSRRKDERTNGQL